LEGCYRLYPASGTILTPQAGILSALPGKTGVKAGLITLILLDRPHKIALCYPACFNVMLLGNYPDLVDIHGGVSISTDYLLYDSVHPFFPDILRQGRPKF
jgi:hypothetical protein